MFLRTLLVALLVVVFSATGFVLGRFTAPAPTFEPSSNRTDADELDAAWNDFIRAQQETLELFRSDEFFSNDQERAEAYRGLLHALVGSIKSGALMDPDFPRFMRAVDWTAKSGLDNPDNNYYVALIRDDADYRIIGTRGTTKNLIFQIVVGQPGVRNAGTSTNVSVLDARDMKIGADGEFEILVSRDDPGPDHNWLPSGAGAGTLLVRFTHSDWSREQAGSLRIERIGAEGEAEPALTSQAMAHKLREVAVNLFDRNATWLDYANKAWTLMPRNGISKSRPSQGGLVGQYSAFGSWDLADDQAILLTSHPSSASYQGIELGSLWFVSLDYETHTSSMTADQAYLSRDDRYHFVISARDPGIQNWLDVEQHRRGLIMMRWQGLEAPLPEEAQPSAQLVSFDEIHQRLPKDVPRFNEAQRREQIRTRRANVHRRFDG